MGPEAKEVAMSLAIVLAIIALVILILVCGLRWLTGSWIAACVIVASVVVIGGFIPIYNGYSVWGGLRLLTTTDWKY